MTRSTQTDNCSRQLCDRKVHARGLCHRHYMHQRRTAGEINNDGGKYRSVGYPTWWARLINGQPPFRPSTKPACSGLGAGLFYPDAIEEEPDANAICRRCPARMECLDYGVEHDEWGVWGGIPERIRRREAKKGVSPADIAFEYDLSLDMKEPPAE